MYSNLIIGQNLTTKLVVALLNIFLLEVNFDKSIIGLHFLLTLRSIVISSKNYNFWLFKIMHNI